MGINVVLATSAIVVAAKMLQSRHFIKVFIMSTVQGLFALFAVNAIGIVTSVTIAVNPLTVAICCVGGIPGVILLLMLRFLSGG